jgi:hypothetical protein
MKHSSLFHQRLNANGKVFRASATDEASVQWKSLNYNISNWPQDSSMGATTFSITTLSMMTFSMMMLSI